MMMAARTHADHPHYYRSWISSRSAVSAATADDVVPLGVVISAFSLAELLAVPSNRVALRSGLTAFHRPVVAPAEGIARTAAFSEFGGGRGGPRRVECRQGGSVIGRE
jgi:hypothetical protein